MIRAPPNSTDPLAPVHIDERRSSPDVRAGRLVSILRAVAGAFVAKGLILGYDLRLRRGARGGSKRIVPAEIALSSAMSSSG